MKTIKNIGIIVLMLVILTGCTTKEKRKEELRNILVEYGNEVYVADFWRKGGIEPGTYKTTLNEVNKYLHKDLSKFKEEECDLDKTRIEFIVKESNNSNKTNYKFNYVLSCKKLK